MFNKSLTKIMTIMLIGVLAIGLFTGCGQKQESKNEVKSTDSQQSAEKNKTTTKEEQQVINIAVFEGGYGSGFYEDAIAAFEKDFPEYRVEMTASPKIEDIIKPQLVAGNPPDMICEFSTNRLGSMAADGALAPINDVFDQMVPGENVLIKDKMIAGALEIACSPLDDGNIYYAPISGGRAGYLNYDKKLFRDKGWEPPKTWDEFFELGDKAKEEGYALITYQGLYPGYFNEILFSNIASHAGEDALSDILSYEEGAWRNPKVKEVLDIFEKIAQGGYLMEGTVALNHTQSQTEWLNGKALFLPCGRWLENEMKDAIPANFEMTNIAVPLVDKKDDYYASIGFGYNVIPAKAKNIEGAKIFLTYLYRDDMVRSFTENTKGLMGVENVMDKVGDLVTPYIKDATNAVSDAKAYVVKWQATPPTQVKISDEIFNPISSIMNKEITTDEWIERIEAATAKIREDIEKAN